MPTGIGIDAVTVGEELVGRTALDDRLLVRAEFHNLGIVMGCAVGTSSSAMRYSVGTGSDPVSVALGSRSGADGASKFIVPTGSITTTAAPASNSRLDVVWARQNDPSKGDADNQAVLGVTQGTAAASPVKPSIPAGAVTLAVYNVPAGITRTSQASRVEIGEHAIPYGASLGVLHRFTDTSSGPQSQNRVALGAGQLVLPTPRLVNFSLAPTVSVASTTGSGIILYRIIVDGAEAFATVYEAGGRFETGYLSHLMELSAGRHTVSYTREHVTGDAFHQRHGLHSGRRYSGTTFIAEDRGVA